MVTTGYLRHFYELSSFLNPKPTIGLPFCVIEIFFEYFLKAAMGTSNKVWRRFWATNNVYNLGGSWSGTMTLSIS